MTTRISVRIDSPAGPTRFEVERDTDLAAVTEAAELLLMDRRAPILAQLAQVAELLDVVTALPVPPLRRNAATESVAGVGAYVEDAAPPLGPQQPLSRPVEVP